MSNENLLDVRHLLCPMPVIKTQNYLKQRSPGDIVKVICTDPGAIEDIPAWCRVHGHSLLKYTKEQQEIVFIIRKEATDESVMG